MSASSGLMLQSTRPSIVPTATPHSPWPVRSAVRRYHASSASRSFGSERLRRRRDGAAMAPHTTANANVPEKTTGHARLEVDDA